MSLTFRSLSPTFEDFQAKRRELEQKEVVRGLSSFLLRIATLVFAATGCVLSSLAWWRRHHHEANHGSGWLAACTLIVCLLFTLWIAAWEFRRKQLRVERRGQHPSTS